MQNSFFVFIACFPEIVHCVSNWIFALFPLLYISGSPKMMMVKNDDLRSYCTKSSYCCLLLQMAMMDVN